MNILNRFLLIVLAVLVVSCNQLNTENSQYIKTSYSDEFYKYTNTKENYFPGELKMENDKGILSANTCSEYLSNLADYNVVESDENMHMRLYYLPCVMDVLQVKAKGSKSSLFDGDLSRVITNELDLTTFRSSLRRKLDKNIKTFNALKYEYNYADMQVTVKRSNWEYVFLLLGKGDYDGDGFEDLIVLFVDQALTSSYYSSSLLLLHKNNSTHGWFASDAVELIH